MQIKKDTERRSERERKREWENKCAIDERN